MITIGAQLPTVIRTFAQLLSSTRRGACVAREGLLADITAVAHQMTTR
ncbi:hypothetical protein [Streptomyces halobius]|uniref:Uncharacterized protein n=1 Tax=Streptomyces halobius TaxID=2879846 RepID=A0ABY4M2E7_9ACTN|nr:hypothetical protein [Streptomyces halobius]UQA91939.1 hypothetical protein K9S39_08800 [Streptomyces halobius]